jgi:hypothetical protein
MKKKKNPYTPGLVFQARKRNGGAMADKRTKRQNRNSWRKEI